MASFDVVLRTGASLHPDGEPTQFISEYSGVIICTDDVTGQATKVGRVRGLRVHAGLAHNAGESLFDVCDAHSQELHLLHTLLYEPGGYGFREQLVRRFDAMEPDLLVLDYVVLDPKWRRLKLGLLAVRKVVDLLGGGCGLAVSCIAPLRPAAHKVLRVPREWLPCNTTKQERRAVRVKLRRYFRRMGFRRLGGTPYYALPLNQATPDAGALLGRESD
jgi:hypothetical protein